MLQLSGCDGEGEDGARHGDEAGRRRSHEAPSIQGQPFAQIYHRAQVRVYNTIQSVYARDLQVCMRVCTLSCGHCLHCMRKSNAP